MKVKKSLDWETFWKLDPCTDLCDKCKHNFDCNEESKHEDCLIWVNLPDIIAAYQHVQVGLMKVEIEEACKHNVYERCEFNVDHIVQASPQICPLLEGEGDEDEDSND